MTNRFYAAFWFPIVAAVMGLGYLALRRLAYDVADYVTSTR